MLGGVGEDMMFAVFFCCGLSPHAPTTQRPIIKTTTHQPKSQVRRKPIFHIHTYTQHMTPHQPPAQSINAVPKPPYQCNQPPFEKNANPKSQVRRKPIFHVEHCELFWQDAGDYLCAKVTNI